MGNGVENQGIKPEQQSPEAQHGAADTQMAKVASDFNKPGTTQDLRTNDLRSLNSTLENTGILPGVQITGMHAENPNDPKDHREHVDMTPTAKDQTISNSTYNPDTHQLEFSRTPPQLPGNRGAENVTIDMITGKETVTAPGDNGTTRTTTRDHVGAEACTTVVTDKSGKVLQTEGIDGSGKLSTGQYQYDTSGKVTGFTQDGKTTTVPADATGAKVDPKTGDLDYTRKDGVQVALHADATTTLTMPADASGKTGRSFTVDRDGKTSYQVQPGDTMWNVSKDLAKLQGNANPSDKDVQSIVDQIGHAGDSHNPNAIKAGETISFGVGSKPGDPTASKDTVDLRSQLPETKDGPVIQPAQGDKPAMWQPPGKAAIALPTDMDPSKASLDASGHLVYTNKEGNSVNVNPDKGQETTTFKNGTQVTRNHVGGDLTDYHSNDPNEPKCENGKWSNLPDTDKDHAPSNVQLDDNGKIKSYKTSQGIDITLGDDGKPSKYSSHGFSFEHHSDGWYYHQDSGGDYVKIDEPKIGSNGSITTKENGGWNSGREHSLSGDGQYTGNGTITSVLASALVTSPALTAASYAADAAFGTNSHQYLNDFSNNALHSFVESPINALTGLVGKVETGLGVSEDNKLNLSRYQLNIFHPVDKNAPAADLAAGVAGTAVGTLAGFIVPFDDGLQALRVGSKIAKAVDLGEAWAPIATELGIPIDAGKKNEGKGPQSLRDWIEIATS